MSPRRRRAAKLTRHAARAGGTRKTDPGLMATLTSALHDNILLYQEALQRADKGQQYNPGPWPVAKDVPQIIFDAWVQEVPAVWKIAYKAQTGEVVLYGDPLPPHARTAGWFLMEISEQLEDNLGRAVKKSFAYSAEERGLIPSFGSKVPDFAIIPDPESGRAVQATVVGEIGYHGFQKVKEEVNLWCRNLHPVVIGVKITDNTALSTPHDPRIEVLVKVTGKQDQEFCVGQGATHLCAEGTDVIQIPSELFLPRAQRIQRSIREPIKLDLFSLLIKVRRWVMQRDTL